jgi:S-adenosylmethionine:tRNA ribosyltransferase-isomerase
LTSTAIPLNQRGMCALSLSDFGYTLPESHIATVPAEPRDAARLLHVQGKNLADRVVSDLPTLLRPSDLLVVNDTRVIPAQLTGNKGAARIGVTLDKPGADGSWRVLIRNAKRLKLGDVVRIAEDFSAEVMGIYPDGSGDLRFNLEGVAFLDALQRCGALALPPYIARPEGILAQDARDYQTMFAQHPGAVAAPTAGLHFTPALLAALAAREIGIVQVTLHVGAGTFLPVRTEKLSEHVMHAERGVVTQAAADAINATRAAGGRIVAVGTTALRLIESAADASGHVSPFAAETDIFILPGYRFRVTDLLFTNFHLPHSTLLMLVSAFAGMETIRNAYAHAIGANYRFYSYGDACLLEPE